VIDSGGVNAFKNGLQQTRNNKTGFFMDYGNSSTYPYSYHWILETLPHKERKGRGEPSLRFWGLLQSGAVFRRMAPL